MPKNSRELRAKMSLEAMDRARVRGDVDAFAARGAGDDAGAFGENPGSESGGGVEAGARADMYVSTCRVLLRRWAES